MAKKAKPIEKVDFKKLYPELYRETRTVAEVRAAKGTFLAVEGVGSPASDAFHEAMGALYALAYTAKFTFKNAGIGDFAVPALEALYFDDPAHVPQDQWRWRLQLRIPDTVTAGSLAEIRKALKDKKGIDTSAVKRITWAEGRALQMLHVGPYDEVGDIYQRLMAEASARGLTFAGAGHEIYLNDPRRVAPDKIKTLVRVPVR
jgi:hypothetical protein